MRAWCSSVWRQINYDHSGKGSPDMPSSSPEQMTPFHWLHRVVKGRGISGVQEPRGRWAGDFSGNGCRLGRRYAEQRVTQRSNFGLLGVTAR